MTDPLTPPPRSKASTTSPTAAATRSETVEFYRDVLGMDFQLAIAEDAVPSTGEPDPYMHIFLDAGNGNVLAFFELPTRARNGPRRTPRPGSSTSRCEVDSTWRACSPPRPGPNRAGIEVVGPTAPRHLQVDLLLRPQRPPPRARLRYRHARPDGPTQGRARTTCWRNGRAPGKLPAMPPGCTRRSMPEPLSPVGERGIAPTLQSALDNWKRHAPRASKRWPREVELGSVPTERFHEHDCASPAAARLSVGGWLGLRQSRRARAQGARRRDA
jgi:catechol 2,3-dioxygenase-like lactoylglutathione lyase family enzyme